jgi:hypothetical protein
MDLEVGYVLFEFDFYFGYIGCFWGVYEEMCYSRSKSCNNYDGNEPACIGEPSVILISHIYVCLLRQ